MASELTRPRSEQLTAIIAAYLEAIESGRTPNRSASLPQHPLFQHDQTEAQRVRQLCDPIPRKPKEKGANDDGDCTAE